MLVIFEGEKQNGTKLGDVILPPWAKNCAHRFIRINREVVHLYLFSHIGL